MKYVGLFYLILVCCNLSAQEYLSLQKPLDYRGIVYKQGDFIRFKTLENKQRLEGYLLSFNDTSFLFEDGRTYRLNDLRAVLRGPERGGLAVAAPANILAATLLFFLADFVFSSDFRPGRPTFVITGIMASTSLVFLPFRTRVHKKSFGWRLYYVNPAPIKVPSHLD